MNVLDLFAIPLRRSPGKAAIRFPGMDDLSYAGLFSQARALAAGFSARGIGPGDRIAFFVSNRPELVTAYLAALHLGAVLVPINLAYRRREIAHMLGDAGPRLLVTERDQIPVLDELTDEERVSVEQIVLVEELDGWRESTDAFSPPLVDGSDLAMLLYTSGTTGKSKGARITHDNLLATMTGLLAAWAWEEDDALLLTLPLFHTHGLVVGLFCALAAGATVHLRHRFDAAEAVRDLLSGEPTLFFGVPTLYSRLVDELRRRRDAGESLDLAHMRLFCSGSAPLSPETFEAFRDLSGHDILERYGMTETGMNLSNPYAGPRVPGTVGAPLPGVSIRIVDPEGQDLPPGETGELLVRGSNVFEGYWQDAEKTAASFLEGSWFRTGDLARRDPATGYLTLLGRRHELIISGGFNIYPREVEEVLAALPGVREAAVVGRSHPEWGEVPVAFLVVDAPVAPDEIIAACKRQMAGFKVPREIRVVDSLPRNALGKVQKHLLPV
ncbi:MAG TPA: AMP-binding protein [Thermoanaerobaculia bacterium]|nr:AMP-binding protein [Thermoanaerobaculia bacterium]